MVDGLEEELGDGVTFTRVNITDTSGAEIARKYGIRGVPAFVLLSAEGDVLYQKVGGIPDSEEIAELAQRPLR